MKIRDEELREELEQGLKPSQIAEKYGTSSQAINARIKKLGHTTTALAVVAPLESRRFVESKLNAIEELIRSFSSIRKMMDACEEWLKDCEDPDKFDISARSEEIIVQYWEKDEESDDDEPRMKKAKASLHKLLQRVENGGICTLRSESRIADPRQLMLATSAELRQIIAQTTTLMMKLADARQMQVFMATLLEVIKHADPETGQRIASAVDDYLILQNPEGEDQPVLAA